jgi:anti-sigma B factor antagonist
MKISLLPEQAGQSDLAVGGGPAGGNGAPDFELTLARRPGGTSVLTLAGELDLYRAPAFEHALAEALEPDAARDGLRVVVDLRAVTFLDSNTLALLLAAHGRQQARGGELLILVGPHTPTTVFAVTGFDRLLTIKHVRPRKAA